MGTPAWALAFFKPFPVTTMPFYWCGGSLGAAGSWAIWLKTELRGRLSGPMAPKRLFSTIPGKRRRENRMNICSSLPNSVFPI